MKKYGLEVLKQFSQNKNDLTKTVHHENLNSFNGLSTNQ